MRLVSIASLSLLALSFAEPARAQARFTPMGGQSTQPTSVSPDGQFVAGFTTFGSGQLAAFTWGYRSGWTFYSSSLTHPSGRPDVSRRGRLRSSTGDAIFGQIAATLHLGGNAFWGLDGIGGKRGNLIGASNAMNADGRVVVGYGWADSATTHATRWEGVDDVLDLGAQAPGGSSAANGVSNDGLVVVGWDEDPAGFRRAALWNDAPLWISDQPSEAHGASLDGSVVVGAERGNAFRWTLATGLSHLGKLPSSQPGDDAVALAVSDDGTTVVGWIETPGTAAATTAFVWRADAGMLRVDDLAASLGATIPADFPALVSAVDISADGRTIVGRGEDPLTGQFEGWVLELP